MLMQKFIPGFDQPGVLFDVVLHLGTLVAVIIYFRKKLRFYLATKNLLIILLGTIPAGLVGFLLQDKIKLLFESVFWVGLALILTGGLNLLTDGYKGKSKKIGPVNALIIGIAQAIAIIPGISRSGATIFAGSARGIKKQKAAEFSFILSLPAIIGANILEASSADFTQISVPAYLLGFLSAVVFGYWAVGFVYRFVSKGYFKYFAFYCFAVGILALIF